MFETPFIMSDVATAANGASSSCHSSYSAWAFGSSGPSGMAAWTRAPRSAQPLPLLYFCVGLKAKQRQPAAASNHILAGRRQRNVAMIISQIAAPTATPSDPEAMKL